MLRKSASKGTGSRHRNNSRSLEHNNRSPINAWRGSRPSNITDSSSFREHWRESRLTVATAVADASHVETGHGFATPRCQASVRGDEDPIAQIEHSWVLG